MKVEVKHSKPYAYISESHLTCDELSLDDQEQLEYIRKWKERKRTRKLHLSLAKSYFKAAVEELVLYFKGGEE